MVGPKNGLQFTEGKHDTITYLHSGERRPVTTKAQKGIDRHIKIPDSNPTPAKRGGDHSIEKSNPVAEALALERALLSLVAGELFYNFRPREYHSAISLLLKRFPRRVRGRGVVGLANSSRDDPPRRCIWDIPNERRARNWARNSRLEGCGKKKQGSIIVAFNSLVSFVWSLLLLN